MSISYPAMWRAACGCSTVVRMPLVPRILGSVVDASGFVTAVTCTHDPLLFVVHTRADIS